MIVNEIDKFRNEYLSKIIEEEASKECTLKLKQKNCFHNYVLVAPLAMPVQEGTCSKCGHSIVRKMNVSESTKQCIIC